MSIFTVCLDTTAPAGKAVFRLIEADVPQVKCSLAASQLA